MAGLLVSVRDAEEARAAVAGGAAIIDVKEPSRGALGRADASVWRAVRAAVPPEIPVSVALGELGEALATPDRLDLAGIAFVKLGLAGAGMDWDDRWRAYRQAVGQTDARPQWVAVAYADADRVGAPAPFAVLEAAIEAGCAGILLDTACKDGRSMLTFPPEWEAGVGVGGPVEGVPEAPACGFEDGLRWVSRAKRAGLFVALAGGLDATAIARLRPLNPDLFAVRGAACDEGDRQRTVDSRRVAVLAEFAHPGPVEVSAWRPGCR